MMNARHNPVLAVAMAALVLAGPAAAHEEGDIFLSISNGQLVTSFLSVDENLFIPGNLVFPTVLEDKSPFVQAHHPGFLADPGTFEMHAVISFNILAPLMAWNGAGFTALDAVFDETLTVQEADTDHMVTTGNGPVEGFDLLAHHEGELHGHIHYILNPGFGQSAPDAGIYLLQMQFTTEMAGVAPSAPLYLLLNWGMDEFTAKLAFAYVTDVLVPSPAAGFVLLTLAHRRRRRI